MLLRTILLPAPSTSTCRQKATALTNELGAIRAAATVTAGLAVVGTAWVHTDRAARMLLLAIGIDLPRVYCISPLLLLLFLGGGLVSFMAVNLAVEFKVLLQFTSLRRY